MTFLGTYVCLLRLKQLLLMIVDTVKSSTHGFRSLITATR